MRIERLGEGQEVIVRIAHLEREAAVGEILVTVQQAVNPFAGSGTQLALQQFDDIGRKGVVVIQVSGDQQLRGGDFLPFRSHDTYAVIVVRRFSVRLAACAAV